MNEINEIESVVPQKKFTCTVCIIIISSYYNNSCKMENVESLNTCRILQHLPNVNISHAHIEQFLGLMS